jgi:hypothetical protein
MKTQPWHAALFLFLALAYPAESLSPRSFLLRIDGRVDSTFACQGSNIETLIFQDGLVVRKALSDVEVVTLMRLMAPREAVRLLTETLSENRVGLARGNCVVDLAQPNTFFDFTITWFGRFGRKNVFTVTSRSGERCPDSTNAIFKAIQEFLSTVSTDPEAEQVEFSVGPGTCGG